MDGFPTEDHIAEMNRNTTAGALVSRWAITSDSPIVDHINWEFGFRFNNIKTNMDEIYDYYSNGLPIAEPELINNEFSSIVTSKRLGVHVDGQTNKLRYSLFVNQGSNSRLPTLSDRFHFAHAVFVQFHGYGIDPGASGSDRGQYGYDFYWMCKLNCLFRRSI